MFFEPICCFGRRLQPKKEKGEGGKEREMEGGEMEGVFFSYAVLESATNFESGFLGSSFASIRLKS